MNPFGYVVLQSNTESPTMTRLDNILIHFDHLRMIETAALGLGASTVSCKRCELTQILHLEGFFIEGTGIDP